MANNCLITKLKGVVDNDNLPILNTLVIKVGPYSGYKHFNVEGDGVVMTVYDNEGNIIPFTQSGYALPNGGVIKATNKYNITRVACDQLLNAEINIDDLAYSSQLHYIYCHGAIGNIESLAGKELNDTWCVIFGAGSLYGNISCLSSIMTAVHFATNSINVVGDISNLANSRTEDIMLQGTGITGNLSSLGSMTQLTTINIQNSYRIVADIEAFCDALWQNGKRNNMRIVPQQYPSAPFVDIIFDENGWRYQ